ncbi:MAG: hypothetical protein ACLTF5_08560 [Butyricicoccus sp.]
MPRCGAHLYTEAKARGCNKIALGHHYDDAIETVLMGLIYGGQVQAMSRLKCQLRGHGAHPPAEGA